MENTNVRNITYAIVAAVILGGFFLVYRSLNPSKPESVLAGLDTPGEEFADSLSIETVYTDDSLLADGLATVDNTETGDEGVIGDAKAAAAKNAAVAKGAAAKGVVAKTSKPIEPATQAEPSDKAIKMSGATAEKGAKTKASTNSKAEKMASGTETGFMLQAGKFQSQANADAMLAKVKAAGIDDASVTNTPSGWVVGARFGSKAAANSALAKLKAANLEGFVKG